MLCRQPDDPYHENEHTEQCMYESYCCSGLKFCARQVSMLTLGDQPVWSDGKLNGLDLMTLSTNGSDSSTDEDYMHWLFQVFPLPYESPRVSACSYPRLYRDVRYTESNRVYRPLNIKSSGRNTLNHRLLPPYQSLPQRARYTRSRCLPCLPY